MRMCVYCKRRYKKDSATSFHRFPTNLTVQKDWLQNMTATNWTPKKHDCLCSSHFDTNCFVNHFNKIILKPGSTPTIFEETSASPWSPCPSTSSLALSMGTSSIERKSFFDASVTEFTHESKSDQQQVTYDYEASSSTKKFSCDPSVTVFTHESKSYQEQVSDHDYEASSSTKKFSCDASVTEFKYEPKSDQEQVSDLEYEASSSTKKFSCDASVTEFKHEPKSDQEQVSDHDYEASSSTRKFICDASVTEFKHESKSNQEQVTDHVYEARSSPKRSRIEIIGILHDHRYDSTPKASKKVAERAKRSLKLSKAKVKVLRQHVKRLKIKVANLKNVIKGFNLKNNVSERMHYSNVNTV